MSLVKTGSPAPSRPLLGIALMLMAVAMGSSLDAMAKWFTQHYPVPQLVCIRFGVQAAVLLALAPWIGRRAVLTTRAPFTHVARGLAMILASGLFVAALSVLPLSTSVVLGQTSPLIAAAIAVPMLGERVTPRHWLFVLLGFAGVVVVLRPAPEIFGWSVLLPMANIGRFFSSTIWMRRPSVVMSIRSWFRNCARVSFFSITSSISCFSTFRRSPSWSLSIFSTSSSFTTTPLFFFPSMR